MNYERWGGRRFLLTAATHISVTVLKWHGHLGDESFAAIVLGTVGVFVAGNVYQRRIEKEPTT